MAKFIHDSALDALLTKIATGTAIYLCSAQPTTLTEATTTFALASEVLTPGDGNDFVIADGDAGGRKVTVSAKPGVIVASTGTATHMAICDGTDVLLVTTCTSQGVTSGTSITLNSFSETVGDPT